MPFLPLPVHDRPEYEPLLVFAIMCRPDDPDVVGEFSAAILAAETHQYLTKNCNAAVDAGTAHLLAAAPDALEFQHATLERGTPEGVICGEILLYALSRKESLGAAFRSMQRINDKMRRRGFSHSHLKQRAWRKYRCVAHLWAAFIGLEGPPYRVPPWEPKNFWLLLSLAERVREVGESFMPVGATKPLLDPDLTWKVPPGMLKTAWPYGDEWRDPGLYREADA